MLEEKSKIIPESSAKYQYLATAVVNILLLHYGFCNGWPSPNIILLTSDHTPLPSGKINMEEASWIASLLCVGGLVGNILVGIITNAFGRRMPLILITIPAIIGWLLIWFAQNVYYLYAARLVNGFIGGGLFVIVPLYLNEIANDSVRGTIGSTLVLSNNFGMLLAFVLGSYCDYATTPKVVIGMTVVCLVLLFYFPETPLFLYKQGKISETERSIRFYQNRRGKANDEIIQSEIEKLKNSICGSKTEKQAETSFGWSDLTTNPGRKALTIGIVLAAINQMCGCFAMLNYTSNIFEEAGSSLSPSMSAIIVAIIQIIGSYVATFVDRVGRKFLFAASTSGTGLGLIVLGGYMLLKKMEIDVESFNWIPVASFSFTIFIASWAVLTLPFLVISEVLPEKLKDFGLSFCMTILWTLSFLMVKLLPFLTESLGFHGTMFLFAGCCLLSALFIITKMPETKGRSYEQIMYILQK